MTVEQDFIEEKKEVIIKIIDHFDFTLHQQFRDSYIHNQQKGLKYIIDLSETDYMDSSALGMILLLKDHAEKNGCVVIIRQPNELIRKVLEIAQFHRLFTIE